MFSLSVPVHAGSWNQGAFCNRSRRGAADHAGAAGSGCCGHISTDTGQPIGPKGKMMIDWKTIETAPEGVVVLTKIDDITHGERNVTSLRKQTRIPGETRPMWWTPDDAIYVYYEPTHWAVNDSVKEQRDE